MRLPGQKALSYREELRTSTISTIANDPTTPKGKGRLATDVHESESAQHVQLDHET